MEKFSRTLKLARTKAIPYNSAVPMEKLYDLVTACHWGSLKLFYSEFEFLTTVSKYLDLSSCLIVYIGARPGWRIKAMYIDIFFPHTKWLLYDPLPFEISSSESIIIKTNEEGYFNDDKIDEVKAIANGRKIILINDMRFSDNIILNHKAYENQIKNNHYSNIKMEAVVYRDLIRQQRWGIKLSAEFMLLKFRMFFFTNNFREINFIDNKTMLKDIENNVIFNKNNKKHKSKHRFFLYFAGPLYTQLFARNRSAESRLFVKKLKYYKNANVDLANLEKYKLKYYDNLIYDGCFNYFNQNIRSAYHTYKQSNVLSTYTPGRKNTYELASEYYIIYHYLKHTKQETSLANILKIYITIHQTLMKQYNKTLIKCHISQHFIQVFTANTKEKRDEFYKYMFDKLTAFVDMSNKQFETLNSADIVDKKMRTAFIKLHNAKENNFVIDNGVITMISYKIPINKNYKNPKRLEI